MTQFDASAFSADPTDAVIFAYGFDAAGLEISGDFHELSDGSHLQFIDFRDPRELSSAQGVIIPQGIFETIEVEKRTIWGPKTAVLVDKWLLLERERQVFNLLRAGKWVCFLVGEIRDEISYGIHRESIKDTDLCKRLLNAFGVDRHRRYNLATPLDVATRNPEFESYVASFGIPMTVFDLPHNPSMERRALVELSDGSAIGVEFDHQLFFLPFQAPAHRSKTAVDAAKSVSLAVSRYRRKWATVIPGWVDDLRFKTEEALYLEINSLLEKINRLENQLDSWRDYKAILTTSGESLMRRIIAILESFFELRVRRLAPGSLAALAKEESDSPDGPLALFIQARSTENGIEKPWIDEIDRQREAAGWTDSTPGVLFINHHLFAADIERRLKHGVLEDQVKYARSHNVLLVRTIDLLFFMQQMENEPYRRQRMIELCRAGGGWLQADPHHYRLVT